MRWYSLVGSKEAAAASWKYTHTIDAKSSFIPCLYDISGLILHQTKSTSMRSLITAAFWKNGSS